MWKIFTLNGNYDELPRLVSDYNVRKHRTIGMRPSDVTSAIAEKLLGTVYSAIKIAVPAKFKVGDSVRVRKYKTIFEKGYTSNWTTEVFTIVKVQRTNPIIYRRWSVLRARVASCYSSLRVSRGESVAQEGRRSVRQVAGIRWFAQFMDTQKQCYLINF